jgi:hypothetical protein
MINVALTRFFSKQKRENERGKEPCRPFRTRKNRKGPPYPIGAFHDTFSCISVNLAPVGGHLRATRSLFRPGSIPRLRATGPS